jgi:hypothetical protein
VHSKQTKLEDFEFLVFLFLLNRTKTLPTRIENAHVVEAWCSVDMSNANANVFWWRWFYSVFQISVIRKGFSSQVISASCTSFLAYKGINQLEVICDLPIHPICIYKMDSQRKEPPPNKASKPLQRYNSEVRRMIAGYNLVVNTKQQHKNTQILQHLFRFWGWFLLSSSIMLTLIVSRSRIIFLRIWKVDH